MGTPTVTPGSSRLLRARPFVAPCLAILVIVGAHSAQCESANGRGSDGRSPQRVERGEHHGAPDADRARPTAGAAGQDAGHASASVVPRVYGRLSDRSARNIRLGYALAIRMVRLTPACSAMFEPFHAEAVESLTSTLYAVPTALEGTRICDGRVAAFTVVGGRVTKLCPEFGGLHPRDAALTLVHEALHSAGMPESPTTPNALTSQEISALVAGACSPSRGSQYAADLTIRFR